jgi:hypothetical protein
MDRGNRAVRQFERMIPGIAYQEHLRTTDPRRYIEFMRSLSPIRLDLKNSRLVAIVVYDSEGNMRVERVDQNLTSLTA